jgi:enoyl-CoA hydratase/carnithine racemase
MSTDLADAAESLSMDGPSARFTYTGPRREVVARATELAERFGSRSKLSVAGIKRAVYFGGSMSLTEGLHVERTEFLMADQSKDGQELMLDYLATTDATGELPLYDPDTYARALESGRVPLGT